MARAATATKERTDNSISAPSREDFAAMLEQSFDASNEHVYQLRPRPCLQIFHFLPDMLHMPLRFVHVLLPCYFSFLKLYC
jgi:hypothetical protein